MEGDLFRKRLSCFISKLEGKYMICVVIFVRIDASELVNKRNKAGKLEKNFSLALELVSGREERTEILDSYSIIDKVKVNGTVRLHVLRANHRRKDSAESLRLDIDNEILDLARSIDIDLHAHL